MAKGLVINWMDGEHFPFETYEEAKKKYDELLAEYKEEGAEIDFALYILKKEHCNINK
jgi:hypothetical protein